MISRRGFAGCGICAAFGLVATSVAAQTGSPGFARTELERAQNQGTNLDTIQILVAIDPNAKIARHTHPGIEAGTVLEGESILHVHGKPDRTLKAGDSYMIAREVPHSVDNGGGRTRIVATYIVDRDKPLAAPAPG